MKKGGIMRTNIDTSQLNCLSNDVSITDLMLYIEETDLRLFNGYKKSSILVTEEMESIVDIEDIDDICQLK